MNMSATSSSLKTSQTTKTNNVAISNFNFTPAVISIRKGTTVTWTNKDGILHTVTADARKGPNSSGLKKDQMYSYTYTETGHFPYHCDIHEDMKGLVVVTD